MFGPARNSIHTYNQISVNTTPTCDVTPNQALEYLKSSGFIDSLRADIFSKLEVAGTSDKYKKNN